MVLKDRLMFRRYFSDFYKWNIVVAILFGIAYILGIAWGDFWRNRWLIPACYLVVLLSAVNYFVLFFVALRDLKQDRIEEAAILIQEIVRDKKHNYFNRSGAMTGNEKCLLIDKLIEKRERLIKKMEGYKKSLIYECVTGKKEISVHIKDAYVTGIKPKVLEQICDQAKSCGIHKVILFGSRARGTFHRDSDIDLAVCGGNVDLFQ